MNSINTDHSLLSKILDYTSHKHATPRLWRHSIGRLSCASRIPVYIVTAFAGQLPKIALKTIWCLGQMAINGVGRTCNGIHNVFAEKKVIYKPVCFFEDWTFDGVARDAITFAFLLQKTVNAAWCTIVAPPSHYGSFLEECGKCTKKVFMGNYHHKKAGANHNQSHSESDPRPRKTPSQFWRDMNSFQPNYFLQISEPLRKDKSPHPSYDASFFWSNA